MRSTFIYFLFGLLLVITWENTLSAQNININLVSQREPNTSSSISYGDVWAEDNIACLGIWLGYSTANFGVGIYDISNPAAPVLRSIYSSPTSSHNQFEQGVVRNKIGYFASWSGGGVHIVSLTNASAPVLLSRITANTAGTAQNGFDRVHTMFLERDFLYEAAHVNGVGYVKVFDVSNPAAPFFVRNITATGAYKIHQITAVKKGDRTILYTSDFGNGSSSPGQTDIFDVTNVGTQPAQFLGKILSGSSSHSSWPTPDGETLIVCRETTGGDVRFYDISNPANPQLQSIISPATMGLPAAIPHNPVVVDNLLFLSWYQNGIQVFDITDRTRPVRIGSYDTYIAPSTSSFVGNWGVFPDLGLNKLLLSDIQSGFYVLDASAITTATNNYPPLLIQSPMSQTATQGVAVALEADFTGSNLKYQWRFNNQSIPAATNETLFFSSVHSTNSGNYLLIASNHLGSVTSSVASLSVIVPQDFLPTITAHPLPVQVYAESAVELSVAVAGAAPFQFQWRFNGGNLPGATNATFAIPEVQPENVGEYSVWVGNEYGSALSSNAAVSIIDSPYLNSIQATAGSHSALISWNSTLPADSLVQYSVATSLVESPASMAAMAASFNSSSYIDRRMVTNHVINLTGLQPGTRYSFQVISSTETNSYLSGVYQFVTAGGEIILDNTNAAVTFDGNWTSSKNVAGYYGTNYLWASTISSNNIAIFTPNLPTSGKYDVSVWHTTGTDRATDAPFTITHQTGSNTYYVNQKENGGRWNLIASGLSFVAGTSGFAQLKSSASGSVVIADAVRFVYSEGQDFPGDQTVPAWWNDFYFGESVDPSEDPDHDGYSTAEEYALGTSPIDSDSRLKMEVQAAGGVANVTFWPFLGNRQYRLLHKSDMSEAEWKVIATGAITPTQYGHGIFTLTGDAGRGFYRLVVEPNPEGTFTGSINLGKGGISAAFSEAACGINRIYVTELSR